MLLLLPIYLLYLHGKCTSLVVLLLLFPLSHRRQRVAQGVIPRILVTLGPHEVVVESLDSGVSHGDGVVLDLWLFLEV